MNRTIKILGWRINVESGPTEKHHWKTGISKIGKDFYTIASKNGFMIVFSYSLKYISLSKYKLV